MIIEEVVKPNPKDIDKPLKFDLKSRDNPYEERFKSVILPKLEANCTEILDIYRRSKKFAYRGVYGAYGMNDFVAGIRTDRRPGYLDVKTTDASNKAIQNLGGVAHRGNSIFCTAGYDLAASWGDSKPFIVFPKDGWQVTYFDKLGNSYMYYHLNSIPSYQRTEKQIIKDCERIFYKYGINFNKAALGATLGKKVYELLIAGDSWIGVSSTHAALVRDYLIKKS